MKSLITITKLLLLMTAFSCRAQGVLPPYPYTQKIAGQQVTLKAWAFASNDENTVYGLTEVYLKKNCLYKLKLYFRNPVYTSPDGKFLVVLHNTEARYPSGKVVLIELYRNGVMDKIFTVADLVDTNAMTPSNKLTIAPGQVLIDDSALWIKPEHHPVIKINFSDHHVERVAGSSNSRLGPTRISRVYKRKLIGRGNTYICNNEGVIYRLTLNHDSTFEYDGTSSERGRWTRTGKRIMLYDYNLPWKIDYVQECRIDSLKNKTVVEVQTREIVADIPNIRGTRYFYVSSDDGDYIVYIDSNQRRRTVPQFELGINNNCKSMQQSGSDGRITFPVSKVSTIFDDYNEYKVKDKTCNYFIVMLSTIPLHVSPKPLKRNKWEIRRNKIVMTECGKRKKVFLKRE